MQLHREEPETQIVKLLAPWLCSSVVFRPMLCVALHKQVTDILIISNRRRKPTIHGPTAWAPLLFAAPTTPGQHLETVTERTADNASLILYWLTVETQVDGQQEHPWLLGEFTVQAEARNVIHESRVAVGEPVIKRQGIA